MLSKEAILFQIQTVAVVGKYSIDYNQQNRYGHCNENYMLNTINIKNYKK